MKKSEPKENPSFFPLSEDDWGTLYFNPTFIGEYRVNDLLFMINWATLLFTNVVYTSNNEESIKLDDGNCIPLGDRGHKKSLNTIFDHTLRYVKESIKSHSFYTSSPLSSSTNKELVLPNRIHAKVLTIPKCRKKHHSKLMHLLFCMYHCYHDHSTNDCQALNFKVQKPINNKVIHIYYSDEFHFNLNVFK